MMDGVTCWKSKGSWQPSPFDGLEKSLPVNFIAEKEYSKQILRKLEDPKKFFTGKSSCDVIQYVNELRQGRLVRRNLVIPAREMSGLAVTEICLCGYSCKVNSWVEALGRVLFVLAERHAEEVEYLHDAGLLVWLRPSDKGKSIVESILTNQYRASFANIQKVCKCIQWLMLMCGVSLCATAFEYATCSKGDWKVTQFMEKLKATAKTEVTSKVPSIPGMPVRTNRPLKPATKRHLTDGYGVSRYIVENGVVVMQGTAGFGGDGRIVRSDSESEDTWKGAGYIARDFGRYGGIDGELYSD